MSIVSFVLRALTTVLALATVLAAGELVYGPGDLTREHAAACAAAAGVVLLILQHAYFGYDARRRREREEILAARAEVEQARTLVEEIERDRRRLRQTVETLTAHREVSRAAVQHETLDGVLDEMAGVVQDLAGAQALTLFSCDNDCLRPRTYYQLSPARELALHLSEEGGRVAATWMQDDEDGLLDPELLSAKRLNLTPKGAQVVVSGTLLLGGHIAGGVRLTLRNIRSDARPDEQQIRDLLASEIGAVRLSRLNLREALDHPQRLHYELHRRVAELAYPLLQGEEQLGVLKLRFDCGRDNVEQALLERAKLLAESARHVARTIRGEQLYEQTIKDALTGLYNKRYMVEQLERLQALALRHGKKLTLVLVDIDHFKKVNDTWGHLTGDIILREVSAIIRDGLRHGDIPCRYGGEELAVLLPEVGVGGAHEVADRLRARIAATAFTSDKGEKLHVTASFGLADVAPEMRRIEDLIARADAALYHSKENGRNQVTAWTPQRRASLDDSRAAV